MNTDPSRKRLDIARCHLKAEAEGWTRLRWAKTISGCWAVAGLFRVGLSSDNFFLYGPTKFVTRALHHCINDGIRCMQISKFKKAITIRMSIQIKFELHHYFFYCKIFKIRPHLPMFAWCFLKYFLIPNN